MKDSSIDSRIRETDPEGAKAMDARYKVLDQHGAGATIDPQLKKNATDSVVPVNDKGIVVPDAPAPTADEPKGKPDKK